MTLKELNYIMNTYNFHATYSPKTNETFIVNNLTNKTVAKVDEKSCHRRYKLSSWGTYPDILTRILFKYQDTPHKSKMIPQPKSYTEN